MFQRFYFSHMKRLLQYTSHKKILCVISLSPHALALTSHLLSLPLISLPHGPTASPMHQATLALSRSSSPLLGMSVSLMPMHLWLACIHYMHALHLVSTTYTLPYCTCTPHLVLRVSMLPAAKLPAAKLTLHDTCYSVLCTCTAYFQAERALPLSCNVCLTFVARHVYSAHALQALVQDTRVNLRRTPESQNTHGTAFMRCICGGYEEGRGGIQKCCVCWKGQKTQL